MSGIQITQRSISSFFRSTGAKHCIVKGEIGRGRVIQAKFHYAAHSDCCFFAPCRNILTYLLTYLLN